MSLNNRRHDFVQLPLPYMGRKRRAWRWVRRALCSEWFNVFLALAVVVAVLAFLPIGGAE